MAVEATHLKLFPQQFVLNRESFMNPSHQDHGLQAYNQQQMCLPAIPLPGSHHSFYSTQPKNSINSESGLTCNIPASRKRSRDSSEELYAGAHFPASQKSNGVSFVGEAILPQIHQYQLEIDAVVTEHTKKIRLELQQRQKQLSATIGESMMKALKEKDDQIQKMARLNLMLQEKVKSLYMENQLWRDLAQTNEATANYLRGEFELALAQAGGAAADAEEEVESCGSSDHGREMEGGETPYKGTCYSDRRCSRCGQRRCSVLLLPCRHLCLCSLCGSGSHQLQTCPVCDSSMTATLHVNMS